VEADAHGAADRNDQVVFRQVEATMAMNRDRLLIAAMLVGAAFNLAWALAFPDGMFAWLNWFAAGGCAATAANLPAMNKFRRLAADQTATIIAQSAALDAVSPAHIQATLHGALAEVVDRMRKDGTLPPDTELDIMPDDNNEKGRLH
jgi:hypothetical protein